MAHVVAQWGNFSEQSLGWFPRDSRCARGSRSISCLYHMSTNDTCVVYCRQNPGLWLEHSYIHMSCNVCAQVSHQTQTGKGDRAKAGGGNDLRRIGAARSSAKPGRRIYKLKCWLSLDSRLGLRAAHHTCMMVMLPVVSVRLRHCDHAHVIHTTLYQAALHW